MEQLLHFFTSIKEEYIIGNEHNKTSIQLPNRNIIILYNVLGINSGKQNQQEVLVFKKQDIHCIQLWDYQLKSIPQIIESRFLSIFGMTKKIFGRQCFVRRIEQETLQNFLKEHHQIGGAKSRIKYGIYNGYDLVAVAGFSNKRPYKGQKDSTELIRYCTALNTSITGGLSKCINKFIEEMSPKHMMSYCDLGWSTGKAYETLGFKHTETTSPILLSHNDTEHYNCGNMKFEQLIS